MVIRLMRFNFYLLLFAVVLCGCATTGSSSKSSADSAKSSKSKKILARLTVNVESSREPDGKSETIMVPRSNPIKLTVQSSSVVNETHVAEARLVDSFAGFTMLIQFTPMGTHLLEQYTAMNPGRHFAVAVQFGEDQVQNRWIAAPVIKRRITDGILAFTPDASREEAELIVRGLNNMAIKLENQKKKKIENNGRDEL